MELGAALLRIIRMSRSWPAHTKNVKELELGLPYFVGAGESALLDFFTKVWYIYHTFALLSRFAPHKKKKTPHQLRCGIFRIGGDTYVIFKRLIQPFLLLPLQRALQPFLLHEQQPLLLSQQLLLRT